MTTKPEVRRTDWIAFGHYGLTHYRIWTSRTQFTCLQRHEWKSDDGTTRMDDWINVPSGVWPKGAVPVVQAA